MIWNIPKFAVRNDVIWLVEEFASDPGTSEITPPTTPASSTPLPAGTISDQRPMFVKLVAWPMPRSARLLHPEDSNSSQRYVPRRGS